MKSGGVLNTTEGGNFQDNETPHEDIVGKLYHADRKREISENTQCTERQTEMEKN